MDATTISLNLENLNDDERKLLMSLVEKGNKPTNKVWKPATGQMTYVITADNNVDDLRYNDSHNYDHEAYEIGNIFPTKEAAKEEAKRREILKRWKDLSIESGEEEKLWDNKHMHYAVYYSYGRKQVDITYHSHYRFESTTYFATEASLNAAIKEIGAENVKKYILNIKE